MAWPSWPPSVSMARLWHSCSKRGARTERRTKVKGAESALAGTARDLRTGSMTFVHRGHAVRRRLVSRLEGRTDIDSALVAMHQIRNRRIDVPMPRHRWGTLQ